MGTMTALRDLRGQRRWTDVIWDAYKIATEIDGAQHTGDPLQRWDDMERDIALNLDGYQTLRSPPGWSEYVARTILEVLRRAGCRA
jgi:very-short-patch-repair endonuclease